jgi:hypothetical protein
MKTTRIPWPARLAAAALAALAPAALAQPAAATVVYKCPGNVYTSDRELSAKQAADQGCKVIEGTPITVIQGRPPAPRPAGGAAAAAAPRPADSRVDANAQRARDSDSRRILESELRREEERLAELKREYNNGEPERQGNERNYQRYLDRVADLKASIARKEGDIAAIKREIAKLPG